MLSARHIVVRPPGHAFLFAGSWLDAAIQVGWKLMLALTFPIVLEVSLRLLLASYREQPRQCGIHLPSFPPQASHEDDSCLVAEEYRYSALCFLWATQPLAQEVHFANKFPRLTKNGQYRTAYTPRACFPSCS